MQSHAFSKARRDGFPRRRSRRAAFTLVEVMMAFVILIAGICGGLTTLQSGFKAIDSARCSTLAAQIMQSQIERLRLHNWDSVTSTDATTGFFGDREIPVNALVPVSAADIASRFTLRQSVQLPSDGRTDIVDVTLNVTWTNVGGIVQTRSFVTRYAKNGLYDYYFSRR
jgi:type II secretory pathway pseudopilin PulG